MWPTMIPWPGYEIEAKNNFVYDTFISIVNNQVWSVKYYATSEGSSSTINPKIHAGTTCSGTSTYIQQKADLEPLRCLALRIRGGRLTKFWDWLQKINLHASQTHQLE